MPDNNKKPLLVITDGGQHWNVGLGLLRKAASADRTDTSDAKVILSEN
jgi:hypothetical protein